MGEPAQGTDGKVGIHGRKIVWKYYDDGYNPANTVQLTNQLVLQDKVFAIVGTLGTEPNIPIRPILNQRKVPQIFVSTGASYWGSSTSSSRGRPVAARLHRGRAPYGRWIAQNAPNAKIAVFFQNDDYGKDYLKGLKIGLAAKKRPDRLGARLRDHGHELRLADRTAEGIRRRHVGAAHRRRRRRARDRDGEGAELEARHARDQLGLEHRSVMQAGARSAGADFVNGAVSSGY
jgi:hypothetical protein